MSHVYFIKPIGMDGPIKIGCSVSPDNRIETLATWSPFPLEVITSLDGDRALERRFHAAFMEHHLGHEWFTAAPEIIAAIDAISAGRFDVDTLPAPANHRKPRSRQKPKGDRSASEIIEQHGGCFKVAAKLGVAPQTVSSWTHNGIPASRLMHLQIDQQGAA